MNEGPAKLRALVRSGQFFAAPGALEPLTARIIESLGFPSVYLGGNAIGLHLGAGQPMVTMTETVECARAVLGAISAPLIVDAGAGFGEPAHTYRAVRELERAGIAAIHIDDQPYPKRAHYHIGKGGLVAVEDAVAKLSVAVAARRSRDFQIFARTDVLRVTHSVEQTIERCRAYARAGIDGLMVLDLGPQDIQTIRAHVPNVPLAWFVSPSIPAPNLRDLQAAGFQMALFPFNTVGAVVDSVMTLWAGLRDHGRIDQPPEMLANLRNSVQELIGMKAYWDIEAAASEQGKAGQDRQ
jgi:2-methylisocitrate lyase-like PEP mutase family enzyme